MDLMLTINNSVEKPERNPKRLRKLKLLSLFCGNKCSSIINEHVFPEKNGQQIFQLWFHWKSNPIFSVFFF